MKRLILTLLILASPVLALNNHPYRGAIKGGTFHMTFTDTLVGTSWERVTADTGFTQLTANSTITWMYGPDSKLDSILTGNAGAGTATALFTEGTTADSSGSNNFGMDVGQTDLATTTSGVFGSAYSSDVGNYLHRDADSDFDLAGNWMVALWAYGSTPKPAANEIIFSLYESPDWVQIGVDPNGNVFGRITDDYAQTYDSVGVTASVMDTSWHFITLRTSSAVAGEDDSLIVTVDRSTASVVFANSNTALSLDTLQVPAFRALTQFTGLIDEVALFEDTTSFDPDMRAYLFARGSEALGQAGADTAITFLQGINQDSTFEIAYDTVTALNPAVTDSTFMLYESSFLDTFEAVPLVAYATGSSPATSQLVQIPASTLFYNNAVITVPDFRRVQIDHMRFSTFDVAASDTVRFQARVYPRILQAQGATGEYFVLGNFSAAPENDGVFTGPWTIDGPAVIEIWAISQNANGTGQVEINGTRESTAR